jgi:hypothetical protein
MAFVKRLVKILQGQTVRKKIRQSQEWEKIHQSQAVGKVRQSRGRKKSAEVRGGKESSRVRGGKKSAKVRKWKKVRQCQAVYLKKSAKVSLKVREIFRNRDSGTCTQI